MAELQLYKQPTVNVRNHQLFNKYATLRARAPVCLCVCAYVHVLRWGGGALSACLSLVLTLR